MSGFLGWGLGFMYFIALHPHTRPSDQPVEVSQKKVLEGVELFRSGFGTHSQPQ